MEAAEVLGIHWHEKGHDATRIYQKLSMRLGHTLPAYSTIMNWLREPEQDDDITRCAQGSSRLPDNRIDTLIMSALE
jgi:hypothetical protein